MKRMHSRMLALAMCLCADKVTTGTDAQVSGCISRYLQGTYTMDEFIKRLNELIAK